MKIIRTPVLPYAGTSGWQGTETSKERAIRNDKKITGKRQGEVFDAVCEAKGHGLTALEARHKLGLKNPNQVSPSLTILHKEGYLARLDERRDGHLVYVHPLYVQGRTEVPFRGRS